MVCGPKLTQEVWWKESSAIFADCVDLVSLIGTIIFKGSKPGCLLSSDFQMIFL
jgi:hypothetical protein